MTIIKFIILLTILIFSIYIGILLSKKYVYRVRELKEMKASLTIFSTKIKLTYEPIPNIFKEISENKNISSKNITNIFKNAYQYMENLSAGNAWNKAINTSNTNLKKEDLEVLKKLSTLLGKVDLEGQLTEIELVNNFIDMQIEKAEEETKKNEKLYKTLGVTGGLALVIIFI